jgi:uncharacterized protein
MWRGSFPRPERNIPRNEKRKNQGQEIHRRIPHDGEHLLRLVIDTKVLIFSFFGGNPKRVIDLWKRGNAILCLTQAILEEYLRVMARLPLAPETKSNLVAILQEKRNIELVNPFRLFAVIPEDPEDDKFIDCAVEAHADYIISGDRHLLQVKAFRAIPIYSPKEFLKDVKS